jgi:hypothetical protein
MPDRDGYQTSKEQFGPESAGFHINVATLPHLTPKHLVKIHPVITVIHQQGPVF